MSMVSAALGIDPIIAAVRQKDRITVLKEMKTLYRRYVRKEADQFDVLIDLVIAELEKK